jgi:hypothetical protein
MTDMASDETVLAIGQIAKVCHQANKAFCESIGDSSQVDWVNAPEWQRKSAVDGVVFLLENPDAGDSALHDNWAKDKLADGWKYGPVKNAEKKEHPCLVPFYSLPQEQQAKDALFRSIVNAMRPLSYSRKELVSER